MVAAIVVDDLSHRYEKDWAIRDINFTIEGSGIVGLLGSNGAGKSTCMNIMCGVLNPTKGDVEIDGLSIRDNPLEVKKKIGFLPQQVPLYPEFTVQEYLTYCASLRCMKKQSIPKAVEIAKAKCGISHFTDRLLGALSGGYRQRVGIAQAILHEPDLVVLDEPTNGLDPNQVLAVRELIREIAEEHIILLSTHILSDVEALCNEIKMIEHGQIVFEGTLEAFSLIVEPKSLIIVLDNPPQLDQLQMIPQVNRVDPINNRKYRLWFGDGRNISQLIVEASIAGDWRLKELYYERSSLEEVFAQLSQKQAA